MTRASGSPTRSCRRRTPASEAREARDWAEADRLRDEIEAAGWKIVDRGTDFALSPAAPPDVADGERIRYGSSRSVPSRLDEPPTGLATIVVIATDWPDDLQRALDRLRTGRRTGTSVVVVADAPSAGPGGGPRSARRPADRASRPSRSSGRASGSVMPRPSNVGLRRATGPVAILLDTSIEPTGDVVTPLVEALDDPTVAVAGGWGIVSARPADVHDAPAGDVDAIEGYLQAFRRADYAARGPLDERFRFYRNLDIWWSLVLRDEGEGTAPRRAVSLEGSRSPATTTVATRACPMTSATARAGGTSTGSSIGSERAGDLLVGG